jgi:hypothetical protein
MLFAGGQQIDRVCRQFEPSSAALIEQYPVARDHCSRALVCRGWGNHVVADQHRHPHGLR